MKTKKLLFFLIILLVLPLIYANNYGIEKYSCGLFGIGCESQTPTSPAVPDSPSGGGSSSCFYDWQCINWFPFICPESEIQERICINKGTCVGTANIPNQSQTCEYLGPTEPLFDIYLTLLDKSKEICPGNKIKAEITLENYGKIELIDAFMTYWIINENNTLIAELKDTRAVKKGIDFNMELKIPESAIKGTYRLYAEITYGRNKTAVAGETFEIRSKENCTSYPLLNFYWRDLLYVGIIIIIFLLILILIKLFREEEPNYEEN